MDKKIKAKWVKALRSGEYKQAKGALFDGTGHCCLGVLCRVTGMEPRKKYGAYMFGKDSDGQLPPSIQRRTGVSSIGVLPQKVTVGGCIYQSLAVMNDRGVSFKRIASIIEKYL